MLSMKVIVEIYAPLHFAPGSYDWINIGEIDVESLDIDVVRKKVLPLINKKGYKPVTKMVRLNVHDKKEVVIVNLWQD